MSVQMLTVRGAAWERLARLRNVIELVAAVRDLDDPFASAEQFRRLVSLVARLGVFLGVDSPWIERWENVLTDDDLTTAVLAVARYVLKLAGRTSVTATSTSEPIIVDAQRYVDWLPWVVELLQLVLKLRGAR